MPIPGYSPYRPPRPRPINPFDNAGTTGLPSNPNGTYVANPYPTTAASGQQGAYGAMLPQVNVTGTGPLQYPGNSLPQIVNTLQANQPPRIYPMYNNFVTNPALRPVTPAIPQAPNYGYNIADRGRGQSRPTMPVPADTSGPQFEQRGRSYDLLRRIEQNPEEFDNLPKAQQDAIRNVLAGGNQVTGSGNGQTLGSGDFYGYERDPETGRSVRVVKNAANGDNFLKELRWDPQRKKYVQIGKLMREGKLDKSGKWNRKGGRKGRGGGGGNAPAATAGTRAEWVGSYGVVSFNTATG